MTDKVLPSFGRAARSREFSAVFAYAGGSGEGIVWPSSSRLVEDSEGDLATGALGAYNHVSTSGLDVTFDTGEAIVRGAYCARDTQTTYTLPSSSTTTIYLGWKDGQADTVIIGESGDFGEHDPKLAIWTFDTDSTTVTGTTDERPMGDEGYIAAQSIKRGANIIDDGSGNLAVSQGDGSDLNADLHRGLTPNDIVPEDTNENNPNEGGYVYGRSESGSAEWRDTGHTMSFGFEEQGTDGARIEVTNNDDGTIYVQEIEVRLDGSYTTVWTGDKSVSSGTWSTEVSWDFAYIDAVRVSGDSDDAYYTKFEVTMVPHILANPPHTHPLTQPE